VPAGWVSAGIAAVGVGESIVSNNSAKSAAKANNANAQTLDTAQNTMLNQAETVAQQPFQAYTGTLTAPMSGNEQQGYDLASSTANNGVAQEDNAKATGMIDQVAANPWNATTAQTYMNPYTQDVTDAAIAASNKNYLQNLSGIQSTAAGSGAFGGGRAAIAQADLTSNQNMNIGSLTATGNANAYNNALTAWGQDNNTKLAAANAYNASGQDLTNMTSTQISDLMKTGGVAQAISQTNLDNQYQQFLRQQGWSASQLQSLIQSVGTAKGNGQVAPAVQSNTANQLLGLGSTVAGLFGGGSTSIASTASSGNDAALASTTGSAIDASAPSFDSSTMSGIASTGTYQPILSGTDD
jgi:hypothetical protein